MDKVITSLTVLLTGFVVVFLVLLLLIGIIKVYGLIVSSLEKKFKESRNKRNGPEIKESAEVKSTEASVSADSDGGELPLEIVAVIAAAVDAVYGSGASKSIKSIKKSNTSRSAWSNAGVLQNTRPF